jgi:hypothetical protein
MLIQVWHCSQSMLANIFPSNNTAILGGLLRPAPPDGVCRDDPGISRPSLREGFVFIAGERRTVSILIQFLAMSDPAIHRPRL